MVRMMLSLAGGLSAVVASLVTVAAIEATKPMPAKPYAKADRLMTYHEKYAHCLDNTDPYSGPDCLNLRVLGLETVERKKTIETIIRGENRMTIATPVYETGN